MKKEVVIGQTQTKISYIEKGEGIPIIIWHGWDDTLDKYLKFQEVLSRRGFKVFLLHIPGLDKEAVLREVWTSENYARWLYGFAKELKLNKFFLLGHSFGTLLSTTFAALYPEELFGLIIFAPPRGKKGFTWFKFVLWVANFLPLLNKIKKIFPRKMRLGIEKQYGIYEGSGGKMMKSAACIFSEDIDCYLKKIKIPTLIVYGRKDNRLIIKGAKRVFKKIPHATLMVFRNGDHFIQEKYSEELSDEIKNFSQSLLVQKEKILVQPIGYVKNNQFWDPDEKSWKEIESKIILKPEFSKALDGIDKYSYLVVIYWLHLITGDDRQIKKIPCGKANQEDGVLTIRAPYRPNPIGITVVKLLARSDNIIWVKGLDAFDGTPVLDIKPSPKYNFI